MSLFKLFVVVFLFFITLNGYAIPLAGNYTINSQQPLSATNFPSFQSFADSLNANGISATVNVVVALFSGPYFETVSFNTVQGAGPNATVNIDGNGEPVFGTTTVNDWFVFRLTDVSYFSLKNLRIVRDPSSTGGFMGIHLSGSANQVLISGCGIDAWGLYTGDSGGIVASGSDTSITYPGSFQNISIINCNTVGCGYGVVIAGDPLFPATGVFVSETALLDFWLNGVYLTGTDGAVISKNTIFKTDNVASPAVGINVTEMGNFNSIVSANRFRMLQNTIAPETFRGIRVAGGAGHSIFNNAIYDINLTAGNIIGIETSGTFNNAQILFNTIAFDNPSFTTGDIIAIRNLQDPSLLYMRNNLISMMQPTGGLSAAIAMNHPVQGTLSAVNSNYNDLYVSNGSVAVTIQNNVVQNNYPTLASWFSASGNDANSFAVNPFFISSTNPVPQNISLDNAGVSIPGINTDINGAIRGPMPDIGAFEFNNPSGISPVSSSQWHLFPNPASRVLYLTIPEIYENSTLTLSNGAGLILLKVDLMHQITSLDISSLSSGVYQASVHSNSQTFTRRIVVVK